MYRRTLCLVLSLAACAAVLGGCDSDTETETILDNKANYSIDITLPYATITPEPNVVEKKQALVIDADGKVTVNDSDTVLDKQPVAADSDESNYKTLALGNTGFAVTALQTRLRELGYLSEDVTSVFDEATELAVRRFEQTYGTMQTGVATPSVQARLFSSEAPAYGSEAYNDAVVSQYTILQRGDVGSAVYALQQRLKNLNYPISEISGVFDDATANAVMLFYEAYGYKADDTANVAMQKELYSDAAQSYQGRPDTEGSDQQMGDNEIYDIQNRLIELGYITGKPSGSYDTATQIGIKLFAEACGKPATDTLTGELRSTLYSEAAPTFADAYGQYTNLIEGASGDAVLRMQARLIELGFAAGEPNGIYGTATSESVKLFQRYNGLKETGIATAYVQAVLYSSFALNIDGEAMTPVATEEPTAEPTIEPEYNAEENAEKSKLKTLALGASGDDVLRLQQRLTAMGYQPSMDGKFDPATSKAVSAIQKNIGVDTTGTADEDLQLFIYSDAAPESVNPYQNTTEGLRKLKLEDSGDDVYNLQKRLWEFGLLQKDDIADSVGTVNEATVDAINALQEQIGYSYTNGIASAELQSFMYSEASEAE